MSVKFFFARIIFFVFCLNFFIVNNSLADYQIFIGITNSFPNLGESNREIHAVEEQLRSLAPDTKTFEDWHDVYTGSLSFGVSKKMKIFGFSLWPTLSCAYANGNVYTSQKNLKTLIGMPLSYKFDQEYTYWSVNLAIMSELFRHGNFVWKFLTQASINWLTSDTSLKSSIGNGMRIQKITASFKDTEPGFTLGTTVEYNFYKYFGLMFSGEYSWCRYKGYSKINDKTLDNSALKINEYNYKKKSLVDTSGYILGLYLLFNF